ncbi:MAG TPA: hypothetical protein ENJ20_04655, partial [Bacteroidetes bacterium]|nr:hypothetical protein [Bacteroidota bacterium]
MKNCQNKNPLVRSGTSQQQRWRQGLSDTYVQVDERTPADLLIFARQLAGQLGFYDLENKLSGDWSGFFSNDVSFLIAILANNPTKAFSEKWEGLVKEVEVEVNGLFAQVDGSGDLLPGVVANLPSFIPAYKKLHDYIWSLAALLDGQTNKLPLGTGLRDFAKATIAKDCSPAFKKLLGLYKAGINAGSTDYVLIDPARRQNFGAVEGLRQRFVQDILALGLSEEWLPTDKPWQDFFDDDLDTEQYKTAFGQNVPLPMQRPEEVAAYLLPSLLPLRGVIDTLFNVFEKIAAAAPASLDETLDDWPDHQPHIALYLAFVKLFSFAQNHINGLKERHLDYYFKEVLRLKEKPAHPDEAHLLITLAKHVEKDYLLPAGTAFKAGKDSEKKEVVYKATDSVELNKAAVAHLRAAYFSSADGKLYTAPVANSEDGQGEPLVDDNGQWKPFGPVTQFAGADGRPVAPTEDEKKMELFRKVAQPQYTGFAVASPNLFLKEGRRVVLISCTLSDPPDAWGNFKMWDAGLFKLLFTGEKGWLEKDLMWPAMFFSGKLWWGCLLSPEDPPVLPFDEKIHSGGFATRLPMVQVRMGENEDTPSPYADLRQLKITSVETIVDVTGVKDLLLQNDLGRLDPAKPFQPFGPLPRTGSALYVGSNEIFQKKLQNRLELQTEWEGLAEKSNIYKPPADVHVSIQNLHGVSTSQLIITKELAPEGRLEMADEHIPDYGRSDFRDFDFSENKPFDTNTQKGFIRLELQNHFGHAGYQNKFAEAASQLAAETIDLNRITDPQFKSGSAIVLREPPYTPLFSAFSINYQAASAFPLNDADEHSFHNRQEQFFHLHPFGHREVHPYLEETGAGVCMLPPIDHVGALYIGLRDVRPRQTVSVLLQVAEGSANPLKKRQPVEWHYLRGDRWRTFDEKDEAAVTDGTGDLLQSGLVTFRFPHDITDKNTWLDDGFTWVRAAVKESADAVCNLVSVRAQALRVRFENNDNAPDFLDQPLAAGTISKLVKSDSSVKKIEQPFTAFGNRPKELPRQFYRRISERLRHKDRAITIWDYEHLVLEHFPEIYKVK